ncbi:MAG: succinate dehydrogenase cytochrome b subunit [Gemmatimonadota bacterium]
MERGRALFRTTIGLKITMALSGIVWVGFVIGHMLGNLKVYQGADAFNHYAEGLRVFGDPFLGREQGLWIARIVLIAALVLHVWSAWKLSRRSQSARDVKYRRREAIEFSRASRTMRWGGVALLGFLVYHILHFTTGTLHHDFVHGDAYHNFVAGFQLWYVAAIYAIAMVALGLHLYHGTWSAFQTLGLGDGRDHGKRWHRQLALAVALVVVLGNLSFPVAVLTGLVS